MHDRSEVEDAFRTYVMTGLVNEDWAAWSQLFNDDATYHDHYWGTFNGPEEIQRWLEGTMSWASHVYTVLVWYNLDGDQIVYKAFNRADNPEPGAPPLHFPSLQVIRYAGDGKWASEEDWWVAHESKRFAEQYDAACRAHDPQHRAKRTRLDWGNWVDWARPAPGAHPTPSWVGRNDITPLRTLRDIDFGVRNP